MCKKVSWETETLMGTAPPASRWERYIPRAAIPHVGLFVALMLYTAGGGLVFRALEYPAEMAKQEYLRDRLLTQRWNLIRAVSDYNFNGTEVVSMEKLLSDQLSIYEKVLEEASGSGLSLEIENNFPPLEEKWSILQAVFFASTVLTTIGYGNVVPETFWGRLFCIIYALVGIPLTLTVIADLGRVFATCVSVIAKHLPEMPKRPKYMLLCTLYILIGLALTSTIIELVRRQYARSWQQLRALSGPLADTLRRLGDAGRGVDVSALHDLRKVLTVVTMPRIGGGRNSLADKRQLEWEAALEAVIRNINSPSPTQQKPPIVQIVIYESSV
ncbi:potassium channel subfamily K member 4 isoform X2 [Pieris brassicae]|uniref:potassium channel subfamily K member 4 isoform X2 n=1 Tax=Pieris brassicae TaxID=7116 RepID=UPI001E661FAD|nr:potassium channel subfamily K member 4 isoform X2 [Pieris brassicae]